MTAPAKPLPDVTDPVTAAYWAGTREQKLLVPRCDHCHEVLWPPEELCPNDYSTSFAWEEIAPEGTLWSFATYHRALDAAFADEIPYVVGLVELTPEIKMYGIVRAPLDTVQVGKRAVAVFEPADDSVTFVRWRLE